jgi:hypothetical protein
MSNDSGASPAEPGTGLSACIFYPPALYRAKGYRFYPLRAPWVYPGITAQRLFKSLARFHIQDSFLCGEIPRSH